MKSHLEGKQIGNANDPVAACPVRAAAGATGSLGASPFSPPFTHKAPGAVGKRLSFSFSCLSLLHLVLWGLKSLAKSTGNSK